jgi:hypothetical protein
MESRRGGHTLTTIDSPLLLTAEPDTTDSDSALGSEGASELPCNSNEDDDASKDRGAWAPDGGGGSGSAIDSANCVVSGRGDIDEKDVELVSDRASEDRTRSTLDPRESAFGDS